MARPGARARQRVADDPEPRAVRLPHSAALHRGDRRAYGDRGARGVRAAAHRPQHLHGDRGRRSRGARGGTGNGDDGRAAARDGGAAARGRGDPRRDPGGHGGERGHGHYRGGHRCRGIGGLHLPRRGHGEQHADPGGGAPGGPDGTRGRRSARSCRAEAGVAGAVTGGRRLALACGALLAVGCARGDRVVVGAKNFTESDLLAELVAQQIERRTGLPVERRLHLGGTFVCHRAITAGKIDVYVEYTGTAFTAILDHTPLADRDGVYRAGAAEYAERFGPTWGKPFGVDNTFAIVVRRRDAERYGLRRISDVATVAPRWKAAFGYEFLERSEERRVGKEGRSQVSPYH